MPGKKKDPNRTYHPNYGGSRPHPPNSQWGRKPKPIKSRLVAVALTDEEWELLKVSIADTRERGLILMERIKGDNGNETNA